MTPDAIVTRGLTKRFGRHTAVDNVDLTVPRGAVYGFLGPNGSGKTTTIRMVLGLAAADAGSMTVLGEDMPVASLSVLPRVGALVEGPAFSPWLSGAANLARLDAADRSADPATRGRRVADALHRVGLDSAVDLRAKAYSLGMKQRLGIAGALLQPRDLLVLDEPTNGLDPQGTREVRSLVRSLADDGTTVLVSSHLLAEVEQVCTHVGVMSHGRLVAQAPIDELRGTGVEHLTVSTPDADAALAVLQAHGCRDAVRDGRHQVRALRGDAITEDVVSALVGAGVRVRGVAVSGDTLEDRFVALTGEGFAVDR